MLLGTGLGVLPSLARNWSESEPVLVSANGGVNFWFGNNDAARGTFIAPGSEWGAIDRQRATSMAVAAEALGRRVGEREASAYWFGRGRAWLAENPGAAAKLWGRKLADTLSSTEFGIQYVPSAHRSASLALWLPLVPFGVLLALAALGWSGEARRAELVGWLVAGLAASLLYFTYSRFRLPLLPALLPFAGRGAARLVDLVRARRRPEGVGLAAAGFALLLAAQSFVPFEGSLPRRQRANAFADMGERVLAAGETGRARALYELGVEAWPEDAKVLCGLGRIAFLAGDHLEALRRYRGGARPRPRLGGGGRAGGAARAVLGGPAGARPRAWRVRAAAVAGGALGRALQVRRHRSDDRLRCAASPLARDGPAGSAPARRARPDPRPATRALALEVLRILDGR